jgi:prepilin-type N-terminal cleavage/methylation domain-containing protein/prepilin-type processing-associated H-X9-DG protein
VRRVQGHSGGRGGFTLVELLIVIGVIAVLAGLLLSTFGRARNAAAGVTCASNLRQLGYAMTQYAQQNGGAFPAISARRPADLPHDWIHWQGPDLAKSINGSAIAPYLSARGPVFQQLMRCPGDNVAVHQHPYPYSYSMNYLMSCDVGKDVNRGVTPRLAAVNRASEKIILAEENERTINDGFWRPGSYTDNLGARAQWVCEWDYLSVRHDSKRAEYRQPQVGVLPQQKKRGYVAFLDGHVEYVSRRYAHSPEHLVPNNEGTGRVQADPDP